MKRRAWVYWTVCAFALLVAVSHGFAPLAVAEVAAAQPIFSKQVRVMGQEDAVLDGDALIEDYIELAFGLKHKLRSRATAVNQLKGFDANLYNVLVPMIKDVAAGNRSETEFSFSTYDIGLGTFNANSPSIPIKALGVSNPKDEDGNVTRETLEKGMDYVFAGLSNVISALIADHPYEMYWYDVAEGSYYGASFDSASIFNFNGEDVLYLSGTFTVGMTVSESYGGGEYEVTDSTFRRVNASVQNAKKIVNEASVLSDYDKLVRYHDAICDLVDYNDAIADAENPSYGDPWQLVWVFDGDPSTKVVCEGYAKAFQYLCDRTAFRNDIRCISTSGWLGSQSDDNGHRWNVVRMPDGKNYLVDLTNDDGYSGRPLLIVNYTSYSSSTKWYTVKRGKNDNLKYKYKPNTESIFAASDLAISKTAFNTASLNNPGTPSPILTPAPTPAPTPVPTTAPDEIIHIPSGVETVEAEAFQGTRAREIYVPASVKKIESGAFGVCQSLVAIHFENGDIDVADDFLSGCWDTLVIDAPAGSTISKNEATYRQYLCQMPPIIEYFSTVTLTGSDAYPDYVPLYDSYEMDHLVGYVPSGTKMISYRAFNSFDLDQYEVYDVAFSESDVTLYVYKGFIEH